MHTPITGYLAYLTEKGRSSLTVTAARGDLNSFTAWWEGWRDRPFDLALLGENDLHTWRLVRQKDDAAAP